MWMYSRISQQVKGKVVAVQTIRAYGAGGRRGIAPLILTRRRARRRLAAYITPPSLYPRKESPEYTDNEIRVGREPVRTFRIREKYLTPTGFRTLGPPVRILVAMPAPQKHVRTFPKL
jgi:hypothetical protein